MNSNPTQKSTNEGMSSSSSGANSTDRNPFLVEFIVNFRWLLHFFLEELDYTTESNYAELVYEAHDVLQAVSLASFAHAASLSCVPLGVLQLAKEASLYLLVSEGVLGSCPPTTHSFLLQHKGSSLSSSTRASETQRRTTTKPKEGYGIGSRRSTETASVRTAPSVDGSTASQTIGSLTDLSFFSEAATGMPKKVPQRDDQAMFLLLRWLITQGVISGTELAHTLQVAPVETATEKEGIPPRRETSRHKRRKSPTFVFENKMAAKLAQLIPFYLGAHVIVSRSILLCHCSQLLTVEGILEHIKVLRPRAHLTPDRVPNAETALLKWFQTVVFLHLVEVENEVRTKKAIRHYPDSMASTLRTWYNRLEQVHGTDFCACLLSGELLLLSLLLYRSDLITPKEIRLSSTLASASSGPEKWYQNWVLIVDRALTLKLWPGLHPEEVIVNGTEALSLHVFRFAQEWFAVLATHAEEDARVSVEEEQIARLVFSHPTVGTPSVNSSVAQRSITSSITQSLRDRQSREPTTPKKKKTAVSKPDPPASPLPSTVPSARQSEQSASPVLLRGPPKRVVGGTNYSIESEVQPLRPLSQKSTSVDVSISDTQQSYTDMTGNVSRDLGPHTVDYSLSSPPFGTVSYIPRKETKKDRLVAQGWVSTPRVHVGEGSTVRTFDISDATVDASKSQITAGNSFVPPEEVSAVRSSTVLPPPPPNFLTREADSEEDEAFIVQKPSLEPSSPDEEEERPLSLSATSPIPDIDPTPSSPVGKEAISPPRGTRDSPLARTQPSLDSAQESPLPLAVSSHSMPLHPSTYGTESESIDVDVTASQLYPQSRDISYISDVYLSENDYGVDDSWMSSASRARLRSAPRSVRRQLRALEEALGNSSDLSLEETVKRQQALIKDLMERLRQQPGHRDTSPSSVGTLREGNRGIHSPLSPRSRVSYQDSHMTVESAGPVGVQSYLSNDTHGQLAETDVSSVVDSFQSKA